MSEDKARFRIKKGDTEIEYEGGSKDVSSKFDNIFEWIKTAPVVVIEPKAEGKPPVPTPTEEEKVETRGGARTGVISPAIDELLKDGFLDEFKTASHVLEELRL